MKMVLFSYSTVCAESKRKFVHRFMFIWHLKIEFFGFIFIFIALSHRIFQQSQRAIVQILCSSQQSYTDKNQFAQFINCSSAIIRWRQRQRQVWRFALALITAFVMIRRYTHKQATGTHTHTQLKPVSQFIAVYALIVAFLVFVVFASAYTQREKERLYWNFYDYRTININKTE